MFLAHISVPILCLITFLSISGLSSSFGEIQKSKMVDPRLPQFGNNDVITTSYDITNSRYGPQKKKKKKSLQVLLILQVSLS